MTSHINELVVEQGQFSRNAENLDDNSAISIKSGVVTLGPNLCNTPIDATLPDPADPDDDYSRLQIVDVSGAAHTVTPDTPFGNGGSGEAKATFSGVVGDSIKLIAHGGVWYIIGAHQVTVGTA